MCILQLSFNKEAVFSDFVVQNTTSAHRQAESAAFPASCRRASAQDRKRVVCKVMPPLSPATGGGGVSVNAESPLNGRISAYSDAEWPNRLLRAGVSLRASSCSSALQRAAACGPRCSRHRVALCGPRYFAPPVRSAPPRAACAAAIAPLGSRAAPCGRCRSAQHLPLYAVRVTSSRLMPLQHRIAPPFAAS